MIRIIATAGVFTLAISFPLPARAQDVHTFVRTQLSDQFWSEGANFGDLNNDGINDVISGPWWWQGPDFKTRHEYYPATTTFKLKLGTMTTIDVPGFEGTLGKENKVLRQLLCLDLRFQQGQVERHPRHRFPRTGHVLVRESKGEGRPLDAAQDIRSDRQRVADVHRSDRRWPARARVHHQGPVWLRDTRLERSGEAVDVPRHFTEQQVRQLHSRAGGR